jgi:tetrahydromethanopterin S-methyltransferase subunit G
MEINMSNQYIAEMAEIKIETRINDLEKQLEKINGEIYDE